MSRKGRKGLIRLNMDYVPYFSTEIGSLRLNFGIRYAT